MRELIRRLLKLHRDRGGNSNSSGDELQLKQWILNECQIRWPGSTMSMIEKALEDVMKGIEIGNNAETEKSAQKGQNEDSV